jgi:amino acid transporter
VSSPEIKPPAIALRRELGRWDLTAVGVNQVIGSAVFALPAALAATAGAWSPWMVAAVGGASMLIALSCAEVASRFEGTGGPYLYTRAAFGRFAAFEVGWMLWFTRATSWASVITVLVASLGFYWPGATSGAPRALLISAIIALIAAINIRGIRQSSFAVNVLTIGKLLPLAIVITAGLFFVDWSRLTAGAGVSLQGLSKSGLLLIFAFGGYEVIPVIAGETRNPRRDVPFALIMTIVIVTLITTLAQVVALGTLPALASSKTPLADAAARFLGAGGAALVTVGAVLSTTGNNMGQALSGSRNLFALAEQKKTCRNSSDASIRGSGRRPMPSWSPRESLLRSRCPAVSSRSQQPARSAASWFTSRRAHRRCGCAAEVSTGSSSRRRSSCRWVRSYRWLQS